MEKVKHLEKQFSGDYKVVKVTVDDYPTDILKTNERAHPNVGELCFTCEGKMDVIKEIYWRPADGPFVGHFGVKFENSNLNTGYDKVIRIEVKRGKEFIFNGKLFNYQKPLNISEIEKKVHSKINPK